MPAALLTSFNIAPEPDRPRYLGVPSSESRSACRSNTSRSPPTKITSVPLSTDGTLPSTGASSIGTGARRSATEAIEVGPTVDMSMRVASEEMAEAAPSDPNRTSSSALPSVTIVMTTSASRTASAGVPARRAPAATSLVVPTRRSVPDRELVPRTEEPGRDRTPHRAETQDRDRGHAGTTATRSISISASGTTSATTCTAVLAGGSAVRYSLRTSRMPARSSSVVR